ncbi:MAG: hypothetical protein LBE85_05165 [Candidatus Accumulibacter sp.]|jgi:outer membrane biosynthesis protein TonB|nr:hypothetical protein [Accumulibacter sp.]
MRTALFLVPYLASLCLALPAFAQLGPAGVPGAPGLAPDPEPEPEWKQEQVQPIPEQGRPQPAPSPSEVPRPAEKARPAPPPKIPAACAKAKNVKRCIARQEQKRRAHAACKGKKGKSFDQCVSNYLKPRKK